MAIDRQTIAKTYYGGTVNGIPAGMLSPEIKGFAFDYSDWPQSLKDEYSYNVEGAKELLKEAGHPNGIITNCYAPSTSNLQLLEVIDAYFKDIGVNMNITVMEPAAHSGFSTSGDYGGLVWPRGLNTALGRSPSIAFGMCLSQIASPNTTVMHHSDTNFDTMYASLQASADANEFSRLSQELDKYVLEQHWRIPVCPTISYTIYQPYLKGYSGEVLGLASGPNWWYYSRWWVDQALKQSMGR